MKATVKSIKGTFLILAPAVITLILIGERLLTLVGTSYSEGGNLLRVLAVSSVIVAIWMNLVSVKRVQKDMNILVVASGFLFVSAIIASYMFLAEFGLVGVGYGYLVAYGGASIIVAARLRSPTTPMKDAIYREEQQAYIVAPSKDRRSR